MGRVTQHRPGRRLAAALLLAAAPLLAGTALTACGSLARVGHRPPAPGAEPARHAPASETGPVRHLAFGGRDRTYVVHRPTERPSAAGLPVLLILHGRFGTAENTARLTHFDQVADRAGFLAVYPEGVERSWSDARGTTEASTAGVDDVAFISALIDELVARDGVDPARVYVTGFSNGGILTQQLGCQLAGKLAGIAPVAGPTPPSLPPACHPSRPLPVLEIHGTADPVVPYQGGTVRAGREDGQVTSAPASADAGC